MRAGTSKSFSFDSICGYQYDRPMTDRPHTPLLDTVDVPADLRKLKPEDLRQFADELRVSVSNFKLPSKNGHSETSTIFRRFQGLAQ